MLHNLHEILKQGRYVFKKKFFSDFFFIALLGKGFGSGSQFSWCKTDKLSFLAKYRTFDSYYRPAFGISILTVSKPLSGHVCVNK